MKNYLATDKSVMISSPAGSGKTEKLARRYISLLQDGSDVERILAITFTEKAAAEMKQRILKILRKEDAALFHQILPRMPLLRVSTIHSFCGTLLRRFAYEAAIDPNYRVSDAIDARMDWDEILYEVLMDTGKGSDSHDLLLQTLSEKGFRGLDYLRRTVDYLYQKNPFSFEARVPTEDLDSADDAQAQLLAWPGARESISEYEQFLGDGFIQTAAVVEKYFLTEGGSLRKRRPGSLAAVADYEGWAQLMYSYWEERKKESHARRAERIRHIYERCLKKYRDSKRARSALDFSDLEYLAYVTLTGNPEWSNILYAFDEKTDHILVDEFQDINSFQWQIINRLTEEWRSGLGAKRSRGARPTIFLVGDEKQSIYFFRGANVELFHKTGAYLHAWMGSEFVYEEARENYRSLPAIIDFTNHLFPRIMSGSEESPAWMSRYSPFEARREDAPHGGRVEILLTDRDDLVQHTKQREAHMLARRILSLAGTFQVSDRETGQPRLCRFMDMAILLRKRTHLRHYEEVLHDYEIPYVAVKGIGFYQEPEVAVLRALVYFLTNPGDDYSLYILLGSPLFGMTERSLLKLVHSDGDGLYAKLLTASTGEQAGRAPAADILQECLSDLAHHTLSTVLDTVLVKTEAWKYFHEPQRRANVKKFIRIVEGLESAGKSPMKVRDFLERTFSKDEEPKANVNTEGMNAVRIMTIHAAKGLEFPLVFLPGMEEPFSAPAGENLVFEKGGAFFYKSEPDAALRREDEDFRLQAAKEEEEQKRLFYVAVTRAEDGLFLSGAWPGGGKSFLGLLRQGLGLEKKGDRFTTDAEVGGLSLLAENDVKNLFQKSPRPIKQDSPVGSHKRIIPLAPPHLVPWTAVTEAVHMRGQRGKDRAVLGDIIHSLLEAVSRGHLRYEDVLIRASLLLKSRGIADMEQAESMQVIESDMTALREKGIWHDIVLPREDAYAELPFIFDDHTVIYSGRIDRLIKEDRRIRIYDYKTVAVTEDEIEDRLKEYAHQMNIYSRAAAELFQTSHVASFIIFTHSGEIREI